jgi:ribonuclease BN (tRNA processing enzyme)
VRLVVVGCSGSFPGPDSPASCYLLEADDGHGRTWRLLLDLGNGALGPLQRHTRLADVDAVLLSHLHADHCLDLCGFYVALKYDPAGGRAQRLPVYGPRGTARRMARAYDLPENPGMSAEMDFRTLVDGQLLRIGPFTVTAHRVLHPVEAFGFRVSAPGRDGAPRVLAYTGDTDDCPALDELARDADLLLAEAAFHEGRDDATRGIHLTGRRAGDVAARAAARRLVLTHLPPWNDPERTLAEARAVYDGPLELARPGAVLTI